MKIAFLSYEYPPDTGKGGVATYTFQIATMMSKKGHQVEVFAGSNNQTGANVEEGILVHRLLGSDNDHFYRGIAELFARRHREVNFDVIEAPELDAEARYINELTPDIPLIIKLHSGNLLLWEWNHYEVSGNLSFINKINWYLKSKVSGYPHFWKHRPPHVPAETIELDKLERSVTLQADHITAPSLSIMDKMIQRWGLDPEKVTHIPNPYIPSPSVLKIPADTKTDTITFIGRLEVRKGVIDLAHAIPLILHHHPNVKFRFVGKTCNGKWGDMRDYLEHFLLRQFTNAIEFTGAVPLNQIPEILAHTDICVFPSHWDNFPTVCLEAMAAARGVVGTNSGGMAEMIDHEESGFLIPPGNPQKIAEAVVILLNNPLKRVKMGIKAREKVLSEYNEHKIGALQEAVFQNCILKRKQIK